MKRDEASASLQVGARVFTTGSVSGTYAQYTKCLQRQVQPLPAEVGFDEGAGVYTPCYTAFHALHHIGKVRAGEFALVHGASGGVGLAAVQLAKASGARVIGTASSSDGQRAVSLAGAEFVFNHKEDGYLEKILEVTGGKGVDIILEMLANANLGSFLRRQKYSTLVEHFWRSDYCCRQRSTDHSAEWSDPCDWISRESGD